jgi:hypothetical protein
MKTPRFIKTIIANRVLSENVVIEKGTAVSTFGGRWTHRSMPYEMTLKKWHWKLQGVTTDVDGNKILRLVSRRQNRRNRRFKIDVRLMDLLYNPPEPSYSVKAS